MPSANTSLKTSNLVVHFCGIAISVVDRDPKLLARSGSGNSPKNLFLFIMGNLVHLLYKAEYKGKNLSRILEQIYVGSETGFGSETMLKSRIRIRKKSFRIHNTDCHRNHQPYRSAVIVGGSVPVP